MKRSIRKNLSRYCFTLVLFTFLVSVYFLSLKGTEQTENEFYPKSMNAVRFQRIMQENKPIEDTTKEISSREKPQELEERGSRSSGKLQALESVRRNRVRGKDAPLDVYIFEEHHEALPYWFGAAYDGTIPQTGNTLIHIDGHSDMAPPIYFPGYPFFRWPSEDQLALLMQRNDAFIQSSIMAGLITRMIWVWPEWDRKNHEKDYVMSTVKLGWTMANITGVSRLQKTFCMCQRTDEKLECIYPKDSDEDGVEEVYIDPDDCHIRKVVIVEEINELKAIAFLKRDWINESENILLDIDEDFFGCSYVIKPLLDTDISIDSIGDIDNNLRRIICPKTTFQESHTNKIILQTILLIIRQKSCRVSPKKAEKCKDSDMNLKPDIHLINLLAHANNRNKTHICVYHGRQIRIQFFIKRFVRGLLNLSIEQLRIVHQIGFCSTTTPKTYQLYGPPDFGLCYGANTPFESAVTEFNPTADDIQKRSDILKSIVQNTKQYTPKFVTLCRSVRDGYTPRQHFSTIEREVLTSLNDSFRNINLVYDEDLLDGKEGRLIQASI